MSDLTPDREPAIAPLIKQVAATIATNPQLILYDEYSKEEREKDWKSLEKCVAELPTDARSRPGHKLLDHHMRHFYKVKDHMGRSVFDMAKNADAVEKALWLNIRGHSTPYKSEIRRMLTMSAGMSNVTKYRAITTKAIVEKYNARRVLDPCVGWGGRMLGALAAGASYTGFEPDPNTFSGLVGVLSDLPTDVKERATIKRLPAEVGLPTLTRLYDMVLTSPPYYNLEIYTTEEGQSTTTHPTWESWRDDWLRPVVIACLERLDVGGVSCWSVKNFRTDKSYPLADTIHKIHEERGWKLVYTAKMTGSGRPGKGRITDNKEGRISEEETYCFQRAA